MYEIKVFNFITECHTLRTCTILHCIRMYSFSGLGIVMTLIMSDMIAMISEGFLVFICDIDNLS